jgi:hypothetical protein
MIQVQVWKIKTGEIFEKESEALEAELKYDVRQDLEEMFGFDIADDIMYRLDKTYDILREWKKRKELINAVRDQEKS